MPALELITDPADSRREERSAPAEASPIVTGPLLGTWDAAIVAYVAETDELPRLATAVAKPPDVVTELPASALESTVMAGVAVALWGTWEVRSWRDDRRRRSYLKRIGL